MITPHPRADLLRAIADGKQMQELDFPGINRPGNWCDCDADRALNLIIRGVEQYVRIKPGTVTTMTDNKQYPELPTHFMLVQESFRDEVYLYTADQMRAYADADRAMRAAQAAPAAWRHSRTLGLFDIEEDVPLADGDEWAEPLYLHPPEAPASQDAEDAARYRWLRCKVAIVGDSFHILNIRPTFVAPDPAVELDAVLDAAMAGETK